MGNTKKWLSLKYQCKLLKKLYCQGIRGWRSWKGIFQTSISSRAFPSAWLRFVWARQCKRYFQFEYHIHLTFWFFFICNECKEEINWKEYLSQTSILKCAILWSLPRFMWEMQEPILVTVSFPYKLLKKVYLQGMWWWSDSEWISYQILKIGSHWSCWD